MITKAFSLFDSKAQAFGLPFYAPAVGLAVRSVCDAAKERETLMAKHAADFTLYQVGEFDDATGLLTPMSPALNLGLVSQLMEPLKDLEMARLVRGEKVES